jgi:DNA modification methylase
MSLEYRIGDVFDRMAEIPDGSIDLIVTSPPFLALRSYLPADHPDKHKEIGSEPTPAEFIDTLLALSAEWGRVLAPHGSLCVELGGTYAGSGGAGGDYNPGGLRDGQERFDGSSSRAFGTGAAARPARNGMTGGAWPLAKSMTGIPFLYELGLSYGRNLLTGEPSPAGQWRIRNRICWARPNPPVGALGDKFRPATSYITVACKGAKRYFDLDAVRLPGSPNTNARTAAGVESRPNDNKTSPDGNRDTLAIIHSTDGAPPLDWHADDHPEDGDWLWKMSTQPYSGKIPTVRRVPCGPDDGGERTASPDCPRHGDLPGQVPRALRDERAAARQAAQPHTQHNGSRPDVEQLPGFAPTGPSVERSTQQPEPSRAGAPAATPHSNRSRRTAPDLATTQPGTPSARTAARTAHTSASPESSAPDHDNDESSTSSADSRASREPQTSPDIADIPQPESIPCTCSFTKQITEYSSHYATFPLTLPKRLIEAMCPLRVCRECGRPSERIVETTYTPHGERREEPKSVRGMGVQNGEHAQAFEHGRADKNTVTTGWSDCGHDNWRTGVVLDPFGGSGTTAEAAQAVGRHAILIDLDERNAELAQQRVGMFLEVVA